MSRNRYFDIFPKIEIKMELAQIDGIHTFHDETESFSKIIDLISKNKIWKYSQIQSNRIDFEGLFGLRMFNRYCFGFVIFVKSSFELFRNWNFFK